MKRPATPKQKALLRHLCEEHGLIYIAPDTLEDASVWINSLLDDKEPATTAQKAKIYELSNEVNLGYVEPKNRSQANLAIGKLMRMKARGKTAPESRDISTYEKTVLKPAKRRKRRNR